MAWAYFDTSALIKRYVEETGRREVHQVIRKHDGVVSAVLPIEVRSALRRRVLDGSLDEKQVAAIVKRFTADRSFWTVIDLSTEVLAGAEQLVAARPLRTLDAIHVSSAQLFAAHMPPSAFVFVSADSRQTTAARALGMTTIHIAS